MQASVAGVKVRLTRFGEVAVLDVELSRGTAADKSCTARCAEAVDADESCSDELALMRTSIVRRLLLATFSGKNNFGEVPIKAGSV